MAGTAVTLFNRIFRLSVAFFLTPLVIHSIGVEAYGLWAVVGAAIGFFALLDFGVGSGFVKFLAEYIQRGEHDQVRQIMTFGFLFYLGFGLLTLPAFLFLAPRLVGFLKVDPQLRSAAGILLLLALSYFFLSNAFGIFSAFIVAMQRTDLAEWIDSGAQAIYAVSLLVLLPHLRIYALPAAVFCALGAGMLARIIMVYKMFGSPWSNPLRWDSHLINRVFRFGFWTQVSSLTALINLEADRVILGTFVNVTSAGYYELGNRLASLARILPSALLGPLLPAASAIDGHGDDRRLDAIYVRGTRYVALSTFLIAGFLIGAGPLVLKVWIGRTYPYVTMVMAALLLSYAVNNLTGVGTMMVRAAGQPYYETYYAVLGATINIVATIILTPIFGLIGVVAATVIGNLVGSLYFIWLFHRLRGFEWRSAMVEWLWRLTVAATMASFFLWLGCSFLTPARWFDSRLPGLLALGGLAVSYIGVSWTLLWIVGFWCPDDLLLVREAASALMANRPGQPGVVKA